MWPFATGLVRYCQLDQRAMVRPILGSFLKVKSRNEDIFDIGRIINKIKWQ